MIDDYYIIFISLLISIYLLTNIYNFNYNKIKSNKIIENFQQSQQQQQDQKFPQDYTNAMKTINNRDLQDKDNILPQLY